MNSRVLFTLLGLALFPGVSPAVGQSERRSVDEVPLNGVVAVINNEPITRRDVELEILRLERLRGWDKDVPTQQRVLWAVEEIVHDKIVFKEASQSELRIDPKLVEDSIERMRKSYGSEREFRSFLSDQGLTEQELKRVFEEDLTNRQYLASYFGVGGTPGPNPVRARVDLEPSPAEISRYYREHPSEFAVRESVRVRRIYVSKSRHASADEARQQARRLRERALAGEDFEALAREHSDLGREAGGDLGFIVLDDEESGYPESILGFAGTGKAGDVSQVIEVEPGYFFLRIGERVEPRTVGFAEAQDAIYRKLRSEKISDQTERMFQALIREAVIWPNDLGRALRGF